MHTLEKSSMPTLMSESESRSSSSSRSRLLCWEDAVGIESRESFNTSRGEALLGWGCCEDWGSVGVGVRFLVSASFGMVGEAFFGRGSWTDSATTVFSGVTCWPTGEGLPPGAASFPLGETEDLGAILSDWFGAVDITADWLSGSAGVSFCPAVSVAKNENKNVEKLQEAGSFKNQNYSRPTYMPVTSISYKLRLFFYKQECYTGVGEGRF